MIQKSTEIIGSILDLDAICDVNVIVPDDNGNNSIIVEDLS